MKNITVIAIVLFFTVGIIYAGNRAESVENNIIISVAYLEDPRLPSISDKDIKEIITAAQEEFKIKFGVKNIFFKYKNKENINRFFRRYLKKNSEYYKRLSKHKLKLFSNSIDYKPFKADIIKFLRKHWKLIDLKEFVPIEKRGSIKSYDDFTKYLFKEYLKKIKALERLRLKNGKYIISRKNNIINSYINWLTVMYFQDKYDIVFSNTLIVYDDIAAPYPHAVLRYAKVGGSSFESPKRRLFDGTSAMVNLFEMLTPLKYFKPKTSEKNIDRHTWNKIIGSFIMAHEMGHMIYLIPDVYDHPKGCLMDSSFNNMDYYKGYLTLQKYPFECPKCRVWVDARNSHFLGDKLYKEKKYDDAIYQYKIAAKRTPKKLDIDYNEYISLIYFKIARCYYKLNNLKRAKFYLNKSLSLDNNNKYSHKLEREINAEKY